MNEVEEASGVLLRHDDFPSEAISIIRYFIRTYVGTNNNGVDTVSPLFPGIGVIIAQRTFCTCVTLAQSDTLARRNTLARRHFSTECHFSKVLYFSTE